MYRRPSVAAVLALAALCLGNPVAVLAQPEKDSYFKAPWRGWDTGYFAETPGIADGGFGPDALAVGDLNGDGIADVAMSHSYHGFPGVSVMLGEGDGVFGGRVWYSTPQNVRVLDIELHDFDADGDLDVFGAINGNYGSGTAVGLWRNNGDGTLASRQDLTVGPGPMEIELADVTGDGFADVITTNNGISSGDTVSMLEHNGQSGAAAGFLVAVSSPTVRGAKGLAVVDMNGDGLKDIVVGGGFFREMGVGINTGGGVFAAPLVTYDLDYWTSYTSAFLVAADFDGDGDADVATSSGGYLCVWRNDGSGALTGGTEGEAYPFAVPDPLPPDVGLSGTNAYRLRAIDIDGNGWLDILTANPDGRSGESWNVVLNDGTGMFLDPVAYHCSQNTQDIDVADVDADGDLDVLTLAHFSSALTVHINQGGANFRAVEPAAPAEGSAGQLAVADLDLDGDLDVVTIGQEGTILRNQGGGTLVPDASPYVTPIRGKDVILTDLDGDGYPDMVIGPHSAYPPYVIGVSLNDGTGSFLPGTIVWPAGGSCGTGTLATGDFDNDGDTDIALSEEQRCFGDLYGHIFLFENDGHGNFAPSIGVESLVGFFGLATADFDNDGNPDLITAPVDVDKTFTVYPGNGDMTFGVPIVSSGPLPPSRTYLGLFDIADFDQDGALDVVTLLDERAFGTNIVGVFLGNGDGGFVPDPVNIQPASSSLETLRVGTDVDTPDVDGDGDPDVVITNYASNDLSVFLNDGAGGLSRNMRYGANVTPQETVVADMNGDGAGDLCTVVSRPNTHSGVLVLFGTPGQGATGVADVTIGRVAGARLEQNRPNPFGPRTTISYELARTGHAEVVVFNALGQRVKTLRSGLRTAGRHSVEWDATTDAGERVGSGVYYVVLRAEGSRAVRKMTLVK